MGFKAIQIEILEDLATLGARQSPPLVIKIIDLFLESAQHKVSVMETGVQNSDCALFWREAHQLKSTSGAIGAVKFSQLCAAIEKDGKAGVISDSTRTAFSDLKQELVLVTRELEKYKAEYAAKSTSKTNRSAA